jgi:hypothetical protein
VKRLGAPSTLAAWKLGAQFVVFEADQCVDSLISSLPSKVNAAAIHWRYMVYWRSSAAAMDALRLAEDGHLARDLVLDSPDLLASIACGRL